MRRDILIGILASLLFHGSAVSLSEWLKPKAEPPKPPEKEPTVALMKMPPLEPDEPEPVNRDEPPAPVLEFAPPMLLDVPKIVTSTDFLQTLQPPPPEGIQTNRSAITIPPHRLTGGGRDLGPIFDPSRLDQKPEPRFQANPIYPFEMRRNGITGVVVVGFIVTADGDVLDAHAVRSSHREFEAAAVQAVSRWKFRPGKKGGRAVNTRMQVPVVFNITEE